jgi:hypothetical protein
VKHLVALNALVSCWFLMSTVVPIDSRFVTAHSPDVEVLGTFAGEWRGRGDAADAVESGVRRATESMNLFTRGVARGRLLKENAPPARIRMQRRDDLFTIEFEGGSALALPISGEAVQRGNLTVRLDLQEGSGAMLRQIGQTSEGTRENLYRIGGGTPDVMTMGVTMTSPRVPAPVQYTLEFTRSKAPGSTRGVSQIH